MRQMMGPLIRACASGLTVDSPDHLSFFLRNTEGLLLLMIILLHFRSKKYDA